MYGKSTLSSLKAAYLQATHELRHESIYNGIFRSNRELNSMESMVSVLESQTQLTVLSTEFQLNRLRTLSRRKLES